MIALVAGAVGVLWIINRDYTTPKPILESFEEREIFIKNAEHISHLWKVTAGVAATYIVLSIN